MQNIQKVLLTSIKLNVQQQNSPSTCCYILHWAFPWHCLHAKYSCDFSFKSHL